MLARVTLIMLTFGAILLFQVLYHIVESSVQYILLFFCNLFGCQSGYPFNMLTFRLTHSMHVLAVGQNEFAVRLLLLVLCVYSLVACWCHTLCTDMVIGFG